jgi:hypothetical protein
MSFDNRVKIVYSAQCNALKVVALGGIVAIRENPVSWEDPTHLDYLGMRRERVVSTLTSISQQEVEALADRLAAAWFHGWVEYQGDWT